MVGLKSFIAVFNNALAAALNDEATRLVQPNRFGGYRLAGLAQYAIREGSQSKEVFPILPDDPVSAARGKEQYFIGPDDNYDWILYHKCLNWTTDTVGKGYGDKGGSVRNTYDMQAVLWMKRNGLLMEPDEFVLFLQSVFPATYQLSADATKVAFRFRSVILNPQQVFANEYKNVTYNVKPEHALVAINYYLESTYKPGCFNPLS